MSQEHVLNELSAYVDGEAKHPSRIERHLRQCPDCARRHMELLKLSSHLSAMEGPEVAPAFLTRVMAHAKETEMLPARRAWLVGAPQWGTAVVLIAAGLGLIYGVWPNTVPPTIAPLEQVATESSAAYLDDEIVVDAMARLIEAGADLTYVASDTPTNWLLEDDAITYEEMVALLAEEISGDEDGAYPGSGSNVYGLIDGMEASETETLENLLADYMGKG